MKKEQLTIPLVFLGIVAIIAVIGLILLVMKPSGTGLGIGASYRGGIVIAPEIPPFRPGGPSQQFPAYQGGVSTRGTRTPVMVFFRGEYGNINEASKCWADLWPLLPIPKEAFSCYVVPTTLPAYEVTGWFPSGSTAKPRAPAGFQGRLGGEILCYERTPYNREALLSRLKPSLLPKGWVMGTANGQEIIMCQKGAYFQFPQG